MAKDKEKMKEGQVGRLAREASKRDRIQELSPEAAAARYTCDDLIDAVELSSSSTSSSSYSK